MPEPSRTLDPTAVRVPRARVALSTASVYPEGCAAAFEVASRLGYDAVEVMVWNDPVSQNAAAVGRLSDHYGIPVAAIHAPTLLVTQRVWGREPWGKLRRACDLAHELGADTVVLHPPFRWQREYAQQFVDGIAELQADAGIALAVENMYPWRTRRSQVQAYLPSWNPVVLPYEHVTLDLSHASTSGSDGLELALALGSRLRHLHLADGVGTTRDEHLVPGRGTQPCADVLGHLAETGFGGTVVVEVNTRRCRTREERELDLAEALAFARLHLAVAGAP
jgi:sugar phosphate isomerase/epimerase